MKSSFLRASLLAIAVLASASLALARGPQVYALTGLTIVTAPGRQVENATIVIRDGVIEAVGADLEIPADARLLELPDLIAYPGLIDAYVETSWPVQTEGEARAGAHENPLVRPEREIADHGLPSAAAEKLRGAGFTTVAVAPQEGLWRGRSAVVNLGEGDLNENLLHPRHAQSLSFARNGRGGGYPSSLMGSIALIRQTLLDAGWHQAAWAAYDGNPAQHRPELNAALAELAVVVQGDELVVFEAGSALDLLRAGALIREFALRAHLVGGGDEYKWLDEIAGLGVPLILPVSFPKLPTVADGSGQAGDVPPLEPSLDELRHWDAAPENPKALLDAGVTVALTGHGLEDPRDLLKNLHLALDRGGLTADEALAALTTTPARLLGIEDRAGTIEVGKMANLVLAEGDLFAEAPKVREVWVDGRRFEIEDSKPAEVEPAGTWQLTVTTGDGQSLLATMRLEGKAASLSGTVTDPSGAPIRLERASVSGNRLEVAFDGSGYGAPGRIEFTLEIDGERASGEGASSSGSFTVEATRTSKAEPSAKDEDARHEAKEQR